MVPLHGTPVLSRLARADLPLASVLPLLPQQAGWRSALHRSRSLVQVPRFPQPLWTTPCSGSRRLRHDSRRGVPRQRHEVALAGAASCWRRAGGQRPRRTYERCSRDTRPHGRQRTSRHGAAAAGSRGPRAHTTIVHGCTIDTAEARPPRRLGHPRLAHERTDRYACLRSGRRTGQCSG
jgi:hypothetical protein